MEIRSVERFLDYWSGLRRRTRLVVECIPPNRLEWTPRAGAFTLGDLVRHLATIERYMYAETVVGRPSRYPGCGRDLADGHEAVLAYFDRLDAESRDIIGGLSDADLKRKCQTPAGVAITTWKWLRAMCEHEAHHRGQIYLLLNMLEVPTPPLFGLTSEEVRDRSVDSPLTREVICGAIAAQRLLAFSYEGSERIVEPHLCGHNRAGHDAVLAWLVRGHSESGARTGWRTYLLTEMRDARALEETFTSARPGYNPTDGSMAQLYCHLPPDFG